MTTEALQTVHWDPYIKDAQQRWAAQLGTERLQLVREPAQVRVAAARQTVTRFRLVGPAGAIAYTDAAVTTQGPRPEAHTEAFCAAPCWVDRLSQLCLMPPEQLWQQPHGLSLEAIAEQYRQLALTLRDCVYKPHHSYTRLVWGDTDVSLWTFKDTRQSSPFETLVGASSLVVFLVEQLKYRESCLLQGALGA